MLFKSIDGHYITIPRFCKKYTCNTCNAYLKAHLLNNLEIATNNHKMHIFLTLTDKTKNTRKIQKSFLNYKKYINESLKSKQIITNLVNEEVTHELTKIAKKDAIITTAKKYYRKVRFLKLPYTHQEMFKEAFKEEIEHITDIKIDLINKEQKLLIFNYWNEKLTEYKNQKPHYLGIEEEVEHNSHIHYITNVPILEKTIKKYLDEKSKIMKAIDPYRHSDTIDNTFTNNQIRQYILKYITKKTNPTIYKSRKIFSTSKDKTLSFEEYINSESNTVYTFTNETEARNYINWIDLQYIELKRDHLKVINKKGNYIDMINKKLTTILTKKRNLKEIPDKTIIKNIKHCHHEKKEILLAIKNSLQHIFLILGKAGTGKTTLIKYIKADILLTYTGKGVDNLRIKYPTIPCKTIHSILKHDLENLPQLTKPLPYNTIIIDEISLIPPDLFYHLLCYIDPKTTIILLGDENQITTEKKLLKLLKEKIQTYTLRTIFRHEYKTEINEPITIKSISEKEIPFLKNKVMFITNTRKLAYRINKLLENKQGIQHHNFFYTKNDIVIILQNNKLKQTFNGQICIVDHVEQDYIQLLTSTKKIVVYEKYETNQISLGFAITIHKSQGSEYENVLILLENSHKKLLEKELIYTAKTRAIKTKPEIATFDNNIKLMEKYNSINKIDTYLPSA